MFELDFEISTIFISIVIVLVLAMPYIAIISISIWVNIFFSYDKKLADSIN